MERLKGQDALMVYGEASGWPLHMASLQIYDVSMLPGGLDVERVRDLYRQRLAHLPAFRHRLVRVPGGLDRPVWVEDLSVDVADHIHERRLSSPGTDQQLGELVGRLCEPLLDLTRPLWEVWVIEGLENDRVAILARVHHGAVDGLRGMEIQAATFDLDASAPIARAGGAPGAGEDIPGTMRLLGGAAIHLAGSAVHTARTAAHVVGATGRLADVVRRGGAADFALPFSAPRTLLNEAVSTRRGLAFGSLPLAPVKAAARQEGATVNDVVLAITGGALRRYLDSRGELPDRPLVVAVPVGLASEGTPRSVGGNRWAIMLASLATDVADPVERLHKVAASARAGKAVQQAIGTALWSDIVDFPPGVVGVVARGYAGLGLVNVHPPFVNLVVSSLRGAPFPLYFAGARLLADYPVGPLADGLGLNVTVISYLDSLDVGLTFCPDLLEDPWAMVDAFHAEADEITRRYGKRPSRKRRPGTGPDVKAKP